MAPSGMGGYLLTQRVSIVRQRVSIVSQRVFIVRQRAAIVKHRVASGVFTAGRYRFG